MCVSLCLEDVCLNDDEMEGGIGCWSFHSRLWGDLQNFFHLPALSLVYKNRIFKMEGVFWEMFLFP